MTDRTEALTSENRYFREKMEAAYTERNRLVAFLAAIFPASVAWHGESEEGPASGGGIVYIETPAGELSWHFLFRDGHLFMRLPDFKGQWDGHTTDEKYRRLEELGKLVGRSFNRLYRLAGARGANSERAIAEDREDDERPELGLDDIMFLHSCIGRRARPHIGEAILLALGFVDIDYGGETVIATDAGKRFLAQLDRGAKHKAFCCRGTSAEAASAGEIPGVKIISGGGDLTACHIAALALMMYEPARAGFNVPAHVLAELIERKLARDCDLFRGRVKITEAGREKLVEAGWRV